MGCRKERIKEEEKVNGYDKRRSKRTAAYYTGICRR